MLGLLVAVVLVPELFGLGFIRLAAFDAYQRWAPRTRHSAPAIIVAIDEESRTIITIPRLQGLKG